MGHRKLAGVQEFSEPPTDHHGDTKRESQGETVDLGGEKWLCKALVQNSYQLGRL
jgi:hypothetical protein